MGGIHEYEISENYAPVGVTKLENTKIKLHVNTIGITKPSELNTPYVDESGNEVPRISYSLESTGPDGLTELNGLKVDLQGTTVVLTIPNPITIYTFRLYKTDESGLPIWSNENGLPQFTISKSEDNINWEIIQEGDFINGRFIDYDKTEANKTYTYKIEETASKNGYINILQGYELFVYIKTDSNAKVIEEGTRYELVKKAGATQEFTLDEINTKNWITFKSVIGDQSATVDIYIKNPDSYKLKITKENTKGWNISHAKITAERVTDAKNKDLFEAEQARRTNTIKDILKEMATSNNVDKTLDLDYEIDNITDSMILEDCGTLNINDSKTQTWRIKEIDTKPPYVNILGNNTIIVQTRYSKYWFDGLDIITHRAEINGALKELNYYVCDEDGTDVTADYIDYIDVNIEQVNGENLVSVTIKDPMKIKVKLSKMGANDTLPLAGAELEIKSVNTNKTLKIENGATETEYLEEFVDMDTTATYQIREIHSATGHVNILGNNYIEVQIGIDIFGFRHLNYEKVYNSNGVELSPEESNKILQYVSFEVPWRYEEKLEIKIRNPIQYRFKLTKVNSAKQPIKGAQIWVGGGPSGAHYLDENSSMEFIEEIEEGKAIVYNINELYAPDENNAGGTSYVNLLKGSTMILAIRADEKGKIQKAAETVYYQNKPTQERNPSDFKIDVNVTDPDEYGMQTVEIIMENPTSFVFDLTKKQATNTDGTEGEIIPGTEFKIISSASGDHIGWTRLNDGKIELKESGIEPGDYKIQVYETKPLTEKYVNILGDNYIEINIHINAEGKVTFKNSNEKYKVCWPNGIQITDAKELEFYNKFIRVDIDQTSKPNRVQVTIENPVKLALELYKESTAGTELNGAKFSISNNISNKEIIAVTEDNGLIRAEEDVVIPGIYKYEISEINSVSPKYTNILDGYKIVTFVKVHADGYIELVKQNGTAYTNSKEKKFYIYNAEGTDVSTKEEGREIMKYIYVSAREQLQEVYVNVQNPVNINIDLVKKDTNQKDLNGTLFTVYRGDKNIFTVGSVDDRVEITEHAVTEGEYPYYIVENYAGDPWHVNVLQNKFIKINVRVKEDGTVRIVNDESQSTNGYFEIYEGRPSDLSNAKLISRDDEVYTYVHNIEVEQNAEGISTIKITVENPTLYEFEIIKRDAARQIVNGSKFTAYLEDQDGKVKKVLDNETPKVIKESPAKAGNYIYYITETETPGNQYVNILEDKYIKIYTHLDGNGTLHITNSKFQNVDGYYELYEGNIETRDGRKINNSNFISVDAPDPKGDLIYRLKVNVVNPIRYNIDINKVDTLGNSLNGANFKVRRQKIERDNSINNIFSGEATTDAEINENEMTAGNYIYYITETDAPGTQYNNILKNSYLKVFVKVDGQGKVSLKNSDFDEPHTSMGERYEWHIGDINNPKDTDPTISTVYGPLAKYIQIYVTENNNIPTINVRVRNPVNIKVKVNKKIFGDDEVNLENVIIKAESRDSFVGEQTLTTDKDGNISFIDEYANVGINKYVVTEATPAGDEFVNVLKNKEILVYIYVNHDGTFEIVDEDGNQVENKYYVYDTTDPNNKQKIDESTDIIKNFVSVGKSTTDEGIAELDFSIKNPQKYKFSLQKIDKDTKEAMNGVHFDLTVTDGDNKPVILRNANTLATISTEDLITQRIDDIDGVISVNDILIEKSGTYKFRLHEQSTDGIFDWLYKSHKEDIVITANITVNNGKYIIESVSVTNGGSYVNKLEIKAGVGTGVTNERIKGKFDLKLNKIDSYTGKKLDGAVFDIEVEKDGESHTLYKSTDDVNSMEALLPATDVKVTNGILKIEDIRIEEPRRDRQETYRIILTERTPPTGGYMLLDAPIILEVTTNTSGKDDNEKYIVESVVLMNDSNHGLVTYDYDEDEINITAKNEYFDLALRKSITSIAYPDSDDAKITEEETKDRIPNVVTDGLVNETSTTAVYMHNKKPVRVYKGQEVIYTLRVYNEGEIDGYAEEITDYLPEWLDFVDDDFNRERGWIQDIENPKIVRTTYLSKDDGDINGVNNLLKARNIVTGELDYREIQIKCIVTDSAKAKTIITNIAEISKSVAYDRINTIDRDSVTNNVVIPETSEEMSNYKNEEAMSSNAETYIEGQEDEDDFEKLLVEEFDLSLRKYITHLNKEELLKTKDEENLTDKNKDDKNQETEDENENTEDKKQITEDENENTEDKEQTTEDKNENTENKTEKADDTKYEREPVIDVAPLKDDTSTTANYTHSKDPIEVSVDDIITYTIEVYNEGTVDGYASLIKDTIPEGVEFVKDSEINKKYNWKLVDENDEETDDITKAKYIVSDYLSRENGEDNLIKAFDGEKLDRKFVQVDFKVIVKQDWPKIIKNQAQISEDSDEGGKGVKDRDSTTNEWLGEDDEDEEFIRVTYMDLALRKFITGVNDKEVADRIPQVDATALINKTATTADYKHPKDPILVHTTDFITYTIRVYNEGSKDGYATEIKDDIPDGLEFLPDNKINKEYGWKLVDQNDVEVTDASKAKYVVTNYLSKDNETEERQNLMKAFDEETMDEPEFRDVKITFKVVEPTTSDRIVINQAQISEQTDKKGIHREDRDSTPNKWKGEDDEDIEKVRVQYFDLALRKWVTKAIVIQDGQTNVTETGHHAEDDPEEIVKVDLKKSKIDSVVVKFEYQIRITNEGEVAGYAKEIKDHIPEGLVFDQADNPNWVQIDDRIITTDQLKDTLLQPGESAEVTVVLTWINSETNMGVKVNIAEISKDYNEYGTPDIDSTPNNFVEGEDDIDDAPVMLTIKTGSEYIRYMAITLGVLAILGLSVSLIKDEIKRRI